MILNIDWQQILLHLLNFVILFAILYFLLYNPVKKFMAQRKAHYDQMEQDIEKKQQDADKLKLDYENKLASQDEEINLKRKKIISDAEKLSKEIINKAQKDGKDIVEDAQNSADRIKANMIKEVENEIKQVAIKACEDIVNKKDDEYDSFIKNANSISPKTKKSSK